MYDLPATLLRPPVVSWSSPCHSCTGVSRAGWSICKASETALVHVQKPSGLLRAAISGAALAAALTEVTFKTSTAAAGYMWTTAASTLIPAF